MRVQRKRRTRPWMAYLVLATASLATTGCASLYHVTHYNPVTEAINEHKRPYYHSGHTGKIIPKEHGHYCPTEPPCFGYEPTCWQAWPTDCPNCPPPDRILSEEVLPTTPAEADAAASPEQVPPQNQDLPEDVERILDEPLPPAGDEDPIIPQGSIDRKRALDVIGVKTSSRIAPKPVVTRVAPEPGTRLPASDVQKQPPVGNLIADDSLLNAANQTAVEIWQSQVDRRQVNQQVELVDRDRHPAEVKAANPPIAFSGPVEQSLLPSEEASPERVVVHAAEAVKQEMSVDASESASANSKANVPPSRRNVQFTGQSSRRSQAPMSTIDSAKAHQPQGQRASSDVAAKAETTEPNVDGQDSEIPSFRISTAGQTNRRVGKRSSRKEPAGSNRMIRFVSDDGSDASEVETATSPSSSSLKFR